LNRLNEPDPLIIADLGGGDLCQWSKQFAARKPSRKRVFLVSFRSLAGQDPMRSCNIEASGAIGLTAGRESCVAVGSMVGLFENARVLRVLSAGIGGVLALACCEL